MNTCLWLIRREFWENRAIWVVPAAIGAFLTLAALFGTIDVVTLNSPAGSRVLGGAALFAFGVALFLVMSIYSTWYLLDCLYADRKDRSVLFWKSLPISDTAIVLSKLVTGLIIIPLVYFAAADLSTLLIAFIVSVRAGSSFGSAVWQGDLWLQLQALWIYLIVTAAIWYLPVAAWLLVISAWARRAVMLWLILPPLALHLGESWFLGTHAVRSQLTERMFGFIPRAFHERPDHSLWAANIDNDNITSAPGSVWGLLNPVGFFSSPATWTGAAVGIALVVCAVQLRMRRTET
jgi:ABC-2 type transport system permease protein